MAPMTRFNMRTGANGLPESYEILALDRWEDDLRISLPQATIFAGRVTWNSQRELIFCTLAPEPAVGSLKRLLDSRKTRSFDFACELDPEWTTI
jgi:hypothetical protein